MSVSHDRIIAIVALIVAISSLAVAVTVTVQSNNDNNNYNEPTNEYNRITSCADYIRGKTTIQPQIAIVLGSGLSTFVTGIDVETTIPYSDIPGFPVSTVAGHNGNFVLGRMSGFDVIIMQGRVHYYEGYSTQDVVLPIRVMHELGANMLILTNAAGSLNYDFEPGEFMLLTDHISMVSSPLIGPNISELGDRFTPMNDAYDPALREKVKSIAAEMGIEMNEGVYIQVTGPQYETPTEIDMYRSWGADAVGMSTAIETITAKHMGMQVCGISCITNMGAGMGGSVPSHEEVQEMTAKMAWELKNIVYELLNRLNLES